MDSAETEILRREQEFLAAWQRGDAAAAVADFAEDAVRVGAYGDVSQGRSACEAAYRQLFAGPLKGARVHWEPEVRLLSAEVAVAEGPLTIQPAGGGQPLRGYALDLWRKEAGRWWLAEGHPKFFPPRP